VAGPQRGIVVNGAEFGPNRRRVTIGRDAGCDVTVDHPLVSRHHAAITRGKGGWVLVDTGSKNGTFVDGRRIDQLAVDGDLRVVLGAQHDGGIVEVVLGTPSTALRDAARPRPPAVPRAAPAAADAPTPVAPAAPVQPAAPVAAAYVATHHVPAAGLATWPSPDPTQMQGPRLVPALDVQVTERLGEWAHVSCSNGWSAWVDGRQLVPIGPAASTPSATATRAARPGLATVLVAAGAVLVAVGGALPWMTAGGSSVSAWDLTLRFLFVDMRDSTGPDLGPFLLIPLVAFLPLLRRRPVPWVVLAVLAVASVAPLVATLVRVNQLDYGPSLGIGAIVTFVGGLVLGVAAWQGRRQGRSGDPARAGR
jgi:hypothetical protein